MGLAGRPAGLLSSLSIALYHIVAGLGADDQAVHRGVKSSFIARLTVGFHVERAVGLKTETFLSFSQVAVLHVCAANIGFHCERGLHIGIIGGENRILNLRTKCTVPAPVLSARMRSELRTIVRRPGPANSLRLSIHLRSKI